MKTVLSALLLACVATPAHTQTAAPADAHAIVRAARGILFARYVLPGTATRLDAALARAEAAGRYRGLRGEALAAAISADLDAVAHDKHLGVRYDPREAALLATQPPEREGPMPAAFARAVARGNAGVRELRVLPGNIRYLAYDGFEWGTPQAEEAIATAMRFLRGGDATIIDLRRNGGGSPEAVAALASYFVPAGTPLMRFEMRRQAGEATRSPAAPFSLAGKPLYVLTGAATASAAEEFATHVSALGFGTLVGETTAGAGYRNEVVPLPGGYVLSVSVGRALSLKTGRDWERVGVAPAIAVPAERALERAQAEAMAMIAARAPEDERADDGRIAAYYAALATPVPLARPAAAYAGRYGERIVAATPEGLTMQRAGRPALRLVPIAPDRFASASDPALQVGFVVEGGRGVALELSPDAGRSERVPLVM